jgi:5-(carboxyamino)imidazole ribonucleotide mutase
MDQPRVAVVMGSQSDWATMRHAPEVLERLGVPHVVRIVSAHRTPERLYAFAKGAREAGLQVLIAGAGGAAHLPGMLAALTPLPVIGVPVALKHLDGMDSLLSIVQMPAGVPVACVSIGNARNAGLLAVRILAASDTALQDRMLAFQDQLRQTAQAKGEAVRSASAAVSSARCGPDPSATKGPAS